MKLIIAVSALLCLLVLVQAKPPPRGGETKDDQADEKCDPCTPEKRFLQALLREVGGGSEELEDICCKEPAGDGGKEDEEGDGTDEDSKEDCTCGDDEVDGEAGKKEDDKEPGDDDPNKRGRGKGGKGGKGNGGKGGKGNKGDKKNDKECKCGEKDGNKEEKSEEVVVADREQGKQRRPKPESGGRPDSSLFKRVLEALLKK